MIHFLKSHLNFKQSFSVYQLTAEFKHHWHIDTGLVLN